MLLASISKVIDSRLHWSSELRERPCFDKVLTSGLSKNRCRVDESSLG